VARKVLDPSFADHMKAQLGFLRNPDYVYEALQVYVAGIDEPWEFTASDEFDFHEDTGVLIVRDGPTDEDGHDNADVPEYVFRFDSIVATQLV
jgi:hypothetical protein